MRNDLRFHDNETLTRALEAHDRVLLVYIVNPRELRELPQLGFRKMGVHRAAFLLAALKDFRRQAKALGTDVAIIVPSPSDRGNTEGFIAGKIKELVASLSARAVYTQREIMTEELEDERAVEEALGSEDVPLIRVWGKSLYHPEELPFPAAEIPEPFREFRRAVEKQAIREEFEPPKALPPIDGFAYPATPTLTDLGYENNAAPAYPGGERAGLDRLRYYLEESHLVQRYRSTRNRSLGPDYSTKFSPYLALGCLSPRRIHTAIKAYQSTHKKGAGNNVLFEMRWRDYFLCLGVKYGSRLFRPGGFKERKHEWVKAPDLFQRWVEGRTGLPFVDAHMRELQQTGFMSNRGRVNCSSFLTRDYKIDWRWGAAWFENRLLDYEVCANWFNWHTQALEIYYTSAPWQGLKYDKRGEYVKTWLPELQNLPAPLLHAPWKMAEEGMLDGSDFDLKRDYYHPGIENSKWDWAWTRLKTGDSSSPKRKRKKTTPR